jgi:hypothetical protein
MGQPELRDFWTQLLSKKCRLIRGFATLISWKWLFLWSAAFNTARIAATSR